MLTLIANWLVLSSAHATAVPVTAGNSFEEGSRPTPVQTKSKDASLFTDRTFVNKYRHKNPKIMFLPQQKYRSIV